MIPYFAPEAHMPIISCAPRLAAMKARLVIHTGTECRDVKKSALVVTLRFANQPIPKRNATLNSGDELSTDAGKAEVLLTPGVFLRLGSNTQIHMISPSLVDTQFEL